MSLLAGCLLLGATQQQGCEHRTYNPTIEVERLDTSEWTGVTIYYRDHPRSDQEGTYVILSTPEELTRYREEVEFLLSRLEETELRMNVHEPEVESP